MKKVALLFALMVFGFTASAQSIKDLKINEILVQNDSVNADKFGKYTSWIEIHNTGYSTINVGGCYLSLKTIDMDTEAYSVEEGVTYRIPTNAPNITNIPPQGYMVVYACGNGDKGSDFANFVLSDNFTLTLVDASGKVFIDRFVVEPSMIKSNVSIGRDVLPYKEILMLEKAGGNVDILQYTTPTPNAVNHYQRMKNSSEEMQKKDPGGTGMAMIAMSVVFSALLCLFLIFKYIGIANQKFEKRKEFGSKEQPTPAKITVADSRVEASGEMIAAISYVLKHYKQDVDNMESDVLTINKTARTYSPWSSKIYGLTQLPNRK